MLPTLSAIQITTERLVLRKAINEDHECLIELQVDPHVRAHLGGPRPRQLVEQTLDEKGVENATSQAGTFVVADRTSNAAQGFVTLLRRSADHPGHVLQHANELELSYVLRRPSWGRGLAHEATLATLRSAALELSDQPVLLITQQSNQRSARLAHRLGFTVADHFEEFNAQQTLFVSELHTFR